MHLIVSGFGSYGDVLPMVGLGAAMRARGHRVQAICNPYFRQVVENAGLELLPLGTAEEYLELAAHPDLWHPQRGLRLVMERGAAGYLRETYALVEAAYRPGETVLAAHGIDLASRIFHERHGAPMATVHFAPFALPSLHDTPRYMGAGALRYAPRWLKAATLWASSRWIIDPVLAPTVNALRRDVGLPPIRGVFYGWNHSPQLVLGMFPDWYGAPQPDWPPQTYQAGFPLWDQCLAEAHLPEEVEEFLAAGEPPIVFAAGSANVQAGEFFRTAGEACPRFGRRGILATKYADQLPRKLPASVRHFSFVPFSLLLPRTAALVHHGGIGTCAQGLATGVPQVVMPMAFDQLDNGLRLARLGVGPLVRLRHLRPPPVADALERLLTSPSAAERVRHWAGKCNGPAALAAASEQLELHAGSSLPKSRQQPDLTVAAS